MAQLLPDLPSPSTDHALAQLRSPLRQDPIGPTRSSTLPATLSPPPATRRPQVSAPGSRTNYQMDEREPGRNSYESSIAYQLPILDGPPSNHTTSAGRIPAPLYTTSGTDARRYAAALNDSRARSPDPGRYPRSGGSQSLPPHPSSYRSSINGTPLYSAGMNDRSPGSDDHSHEARSRISPTYPPLNNGYAPTPGYSLPPSAGGYSSMPSSYQQPYSPSSLHFEQEHMGGSQPRRRRGNLPRDTTDILKAWFSEHLSHPYPTEDEKQMLCSRTGLAMTQVRNTHSNFPLSMFDK